MIESAKAHDLKVFEYLKYVYDYLGSAKSDKDYEALTPQFVREKCPDMVLGSRSSKPEKSEVSGSPEKNEATMPTGWMCPLWSAYVITLPWSLNMSLKRQIDDYKKFL